MIIRQRRHQVQELELKVWKLERENEMLRDRVGRVWDRSMELLKENVALEAAAKERSRVARAALPRLRGEAGDASSPPPPPGPEREVERGWPSAP